MRRLLARLTSQTAVGRLMANLALPMANARCVIKRLRFPLDIMLLCVQWYVAYALSLRNLEEMMQERGLFVDHSTIHRWVIKLVPVLEQAFRKRKRRRGIGAVGKSWRLDETYIKVGGKERYWYRAHWIRTVRPPLGSEAAREGAPWSQPGRDSGPANYFLRCSPGFAKVPRTGLRQPVQGPAMTIPMFSVLLWWRGHALV
jgi:hypothetical protein